MNDILDDVMKVSENISPLLVVVCHFHDGLLWACHCAVESFQQSESDTCMRRTRAPAFRGAACGRRSGR